MNGYPDGWLMFKVWLGVILVAGMPFWVTMLVIWWEERRRR